MMGKTFDEMHGYQPYRETISHPPDLSGSENISDSVEVLPALTTVSTPSHPLSIQGILVDPIFHGFKPLTRFYLNYCKSKLWTHRFILNWVRSDFNNLFLDAQKLSGEAVLLDFPGQNPYRDLMALIRSSPLILKTILAVSARDFTNFNTQSSACSDWESLSLDTGNALQSPSGYHALTFKQSALTQLQHDLKHASELNRDSMIASISLLVFVELLESGKDAWKVHLEGVKQLLQLNFVTSLRIDGIAQNLSSRIMTNSFFFDACITYVQCY